MGLDAFVRCRCWEEGNITSPPPFAELVRVGSEGLLELDLPWDENEGKHKEFEEWLRTCCAHPDMRQADEHISNWSGYRLFQQQLRTFGLELFPTLEEILPENNGGQAPAEKAAVALNELDIFCRQNFGESIELVDAGTGQTLQTYIESYDPRFLFSPEGDAGVVPSGYFVRHTVKGIPHRVSLFINRRQVRQGDAVRATDGTVKVKVARRNFVDNGLARSIAEWFRGRVKRHEV